MNINVYGFNLGLIGIALNAGYVGKKLVGIAAKVACMAISGYAVADGKDAYTAEEIDKLSGRFSWIGVPIGLMVARMVFVPFSLMPRIHF